MAAEAPICNRGFDQGFEGQLWRVQSLRCNKQIKGIGMKAMLQGKGRCEISNVDFFLYTGKSCFLFCSEVQTSPGKQGEQRKASCAQLGSDSTSTPERAALLLHMLFRDSKKRCCWSRQIPLKLDSPLLLLETARCDCAPSVAQLPYPTCPHLFLRFQRLWVHLVHEDILIADVIIPFVQHIVHTGIVTEL